MFSGGLEPKTQEVAIDLETPDLAKLLSELRRTFEDIIPLQRSKWITVPRIHIASILSIEQAESRLEQELNAHQQGMRTVRIIGVALVYNRLKAPDGPNDSPDFPYDEQLFYFSDGVAY